MGELKVKKHITYTYETSDGKEFCDKNEATEWQKHLCNLEGVRLLDYKFNPTKDVNDASYVYAKTAEQAEAFNAMQEDYGFSCKLEGAGFFKSVEEMADFNVTHDAENNMYLSLNGFLYREKEVAIQKNIEWLLQEVKAYEKTER